MVLNAIFSTISVILWRSVLLMEEIGVPDKTTDLPQFTDKHDLRMNYHRFIIQGRFFIGNFLTLFSIKAILRMIGRQILV